MRKIAYFYHASIQGGGLPRRGGHAGRVRPNRAVQGLLADGQCFTPGQLQHCLRKQDAAFDLAAVVPPALRFVSAERKARKPSDTLFKAAARRAGRTGRQAGRGAARRIELAPGRGPG